MPHVVPQRPPPQTRVVNAPHPSGAGRGGGYSQDMRELVMSLNQAGESHNPIFGQMHILRLYPSKKTESCWQSLQNSLGVSVELSTAARKIEKSFIGKRCKQSGMYSKTEKCNLLFSTLPTIQYYH